MARWAQSAAEDADEENAVRRRGEAKNGVGSTVNVMVLQASS
jgi:hypothetical protein